MKFKDAAAFSKNAIKTPEIKEYFKQMAVLKGGTNNAYTMLNSHYLKTPGLTLDKLLTMVRAKKITKPKIREKGLEFFITTSNGETIAHGIALPAGENAWSCTTRYTGLKVTIRDRR